MGGNNSKSTGLPVPIVLKRINDCVIPDDKGAILDFVEMIDAALSNTTTCKEASAQLKEANGILLLLKLLKRMIEDAELVSVSVQVFESIKFDTPLVMDFIQFGGLDLLDKAMRIHSKDDFIAVTVPKLLNVLLAIGAAVSIQEVEREGLSLQLCERCQETIERAKNKNYFQAVVKVPRSSDRVNRVLKFMDNYLARVDVQIVALDAVINFARNPDGKHQARETNLIAVIGRSFSAHPTSAEIVWRCCMALSIVASFHGELANDIALLDIHELLVDSYTSFQNAPSIQQQILWLLSAFLQWPKSKRVLHKSEKCLAFFMALVDYETKRSLEAVVALPTPPPKPVLVSKPIVTKPEPKTASGKKKKAEVAVAPVPVVTVEEPIERKEFDLVVPLLIRTFLRETKGIRLNEKPPSKQTKNFKQRRNFDERPKFGTVDNAIFVPGKTGLVPTGPEDDDGEKQREIPDWEKRLNYGKAE